MSTRRRAASRPDAASRAAPIAAAAPADAAAAAPEPVPIDLALQGGGSHGAFTWGVLDRLLDEPTVDFCGVSGTSAGAMNAAVLATGFASGGRVGAQRALRDFWRAVAGQSGCFGGAGPVAALPWAWPPGVDLAAFNLDQQPAYAWFGQFLKMFSPYQFNPFDINPLRDLVVHHVDEAAMRKGPLKLFITATAVRTGQPRVFSDGDLSHDAVLASACLPQVFRAVQIDGEPYWDGGYSGNPAIWPLIYRTDPMDIVLVKINPLVHTDLPDTPAEIADRVNQITFNAGLVSEMRAIAFVQRLVAQGRLDPGKYKGLRLHMVADDEGLAPLQGSSKMNTDLRFLEALHSLGRAAAERWLLTHRADLGQRSTLDIAATFLAPREVAAR
jgi:NTE family protein